MPEAAPALAGFATRVVRWQRRHGRSQLPWQGTRDPYRVWLSEIMLQQTQVATVRGYYERFLARLPTVAHLARADEDEVFALWSGLGYYSRARNLHACARAVVAQHGGQFPCTAAQLATLPGIGRSTAAAMAAFCWGERVAILDGNVKRILARLLAFDADLSIAANQRALWQHAEALLPRRGGVDTMGAYTQGLMDLGATVCTLRAPVCVACPVQPLCAAARAGQPQRYPVKTRKLVRGRETLWLLRAHDGAGRTWLQKRPASGIWSGLYCLPVFHSREALLLALPARHGSGARDAAPLLHPLTHKDLQLHPVDVQLRRGTVIGDAGAWFAPADWRALGLPAPVRRLLAST